MDQKIKYKLIVIICRYAGFYKGVQSAGAAVAWQVDAKKVSLMSQLIVNWGLTTVSFPLLLLLVTMAVKDQDKPVDEPEPEPTKQVAPSLPTNKTFAQ